MGVNPFYYQANGTDIEDGFIIYAPDGGEVLLTLARTSEETTKEIVAALNGSQKLLSLYEG